MSAWGITKCLYLVCLYLVCLYLVCPHSVTKYPPPFHSCSDTVQDEFVPCSKHSMLIPRITLPMGSDTTPHTYVLHDWTHHLSRLVTDCTDCEQLMDYQIGHYVQLLSCSVVQLFSCFQLFSCTVVQLFSIVSIEL